MDNGSEGSSLDSKWECSMCTYRNYPFSQKCVMCLKPKNEILLIEEAVESTKNNNSLLEETYKHLTHWPCPFCTYLNFRRTQKCIQCNTQRPEAFAEESDSTYNNEQSTPTSSFSDDLSKWSCNSCTYFNWPAAKYCVICSTEKTIHVYASADQDGDGCEDIKKGEGLEVEQTNRQKSNALLCQTNSSKLLEADEKPQTAIDIYIRRFASNSDVERLFFHIITAITGLDSVRKTNLLVEYLISEGSLQRSLTIFEARLMNAVKISAVTFEKGDSLVTLAKKCNHVDLIKLMKRASNFDDNLPCSFNSPLRTRLYTKITKLFALRNRPFNAQYILHPYNFTILNLKMPSTDFNTQLMNIIFKPSPSIPPTFDVIDAMDCSSDGVVINRPSSFTMRNRGGANSLCDSLFQSTFGVCDRFGILRTALKYTMIRSPHLFRHRWITQHLQMAKDVGIIINHEQCENDWDEILTSIDDENEFLEPIHIWALSHIFCRPIIVFPFEELENDEPATCTKPRQNYNHFYEGIYLPLLWLSQPITRSPILIAFRNGNFSSIILSDDSNEFQISHKIQRVVKFRRSNRLGDNPFRFLTNDERNNLDLITQFINLNHYCASDITICLDNIPFFCETLLLYDNWLRTIFDRDFCIDDLGLSELSLIHDDNAPGVGQTRIHQSKREEKFMVFSEKASSLLRKAFMSTNHMRTAIGLIPSSSKLSSNERHKPESVMESEDDDDEDADD